MLQVVTTKMTLLGKGTKRTRVVHAIVLYQQGLRMPIGISRGACGIGYKPARPVPARLAVSVETVQDSAPQTAFVTIPPKQVM
jgi:hypothetical protein